jgi:uncharacterized protein (TIGR00730 family)
MDRHAAMSCRHHHIETFAALCTPAAKELAAGANPGHLTGGEQHSMSRINALCVYCGSSPGTDPAFAAAAHAFGKILAENGVRLIFGGGSVGIMGTLAEAVLTHGGEATGIIPDFLVRRERPVQNGVQQIVVPDMHARKRKMFEMADGFVALPGGIGTLEELVEQLTWVQLGRHKKPILIANIKGYWDPLLTLIEHMRTVQFVPPALNFDFLVANDVEDMLPKLRDAAQRVAEAEKAMTVPLERM